MEVWGGGGVPSPDRYQFFFSFTLLTSDVTYLSTNPKHVCSAVSRNNYRTVVSSPIRKHLKNALCIVCYLYNCVSSTETGSSLFWVLKLGCCSVGI